MQKPYEINSLSAEKKDVELVNNLFSVLFRGAQGKEIKSLDFAITGEWPATASINEKEIVFAINAVDGVRLYTKIGGVLKYVAFT